MRSVFLNILLLLIAALPTFAQPVDLPLFSDSSDCLKHAKSLASQCAAVDSSCSPEVQTRCCSCEETLRMRFSYCGGGEPFPTAVGFDPNAPPDLLPPADVDSGPVEPTTVNVSGSCTPGVDCYFQPLRPTACGEVNGFLKQRNSVSVVNQQLAPLTVEVSYRDQLGVVRGKVNDVVPPLQRRDFLVNDLGLAADTFGTACVKTDAVSVGAWLGGITLRKPISPLPGKKKVTSKETHDFALYYPFTNPIAGVTTVSLSTEHRGVPKKNTVANWIRITDARPDDGLPLSGKLEFLNKSGAVIGILPIGIADGGRLDVSGHEGIGGFVNKSASGSARFTPDPFGDGTQRPYYLTTARYYYRCRGNCDSFYTAYNIPVRRPTTLETTGAVDVSLISGGKTKVDSFLELNNATTTESRVPLTLYSDKGAKLGSQTVKIAPKGTSVVSLNGLKQFKSKSKSSTSGAFAAVPSAAVSARVVSRYDSKGELLMTYAVPPVSSNGEVQIAQFDTTQKQKNEAVVHNTNDFPIAVTLNVIRHTGEPLLHQSFTLPKRGTKHLALKIPTERFGTIIVQGTSGAKMVSGVVLQNIVTRGDEYGLVYTAE